MNETWVFKLEITEIKRVKGTTVNRRIARRRSNSRHTWYDSVPIWYKFVKKMMKYSVNESSKEDKTKMKELGNKRMNVNSRYTWLHCGTGL
jgi:hypothetical protein